MLWTIRRAARALRMEHYQAYYLVTMGHIEAVKVGKVWRLVPEAVEDYDKRHPQRKNKKPARHFVRPGNVGFSFGGPPQYLPFDLCGEPAGVERRRRKLVRRQRRPQTVLLPERKPVVQLELELFTL